MVSVNGKGNKMTDEKLVQLGLNGKNSLKMILSGYVENDKNENGGEKVGVVSVMFVSENKELVSKKMEEFEAKYPERYFMVYSVPLDTELEELDHYPSIAIFESDFKQNFYSKKLVDYIKGKS